MKYNKEQNYSVKNTYSIDVEPLSKFTNIENFTPDLFVVKLVNYEEKEGSKNSKNTNIWNGIITQEKLDLLLAHPEKFKTQDLTFKIDNPVYAFKPDFISYFTQSGFNNTLSDSQVNIASFIIKDVIDNKGPVEFIQFIPNELGLKICKDSKGKRYIEPMIFNYICSQLDNQKYDLDKLVEYFMTRNDIAFVTDSKTHSIKNKNILLKCPLTEKEPLIKDIISNIPYYNAEDGKTETICIIYYPKPEDLDKILSFKSDQRYYNFENYIVGEILGANPYLNNPPKLEIDIKPIRKFKSN